MKGIFTHVHAVHLEFKNRLHSLTEQARRLRYENQTLLCARRQRAVAHAREDHAQCNTGEA